jgi:hypothetical protein
LRRCFAPNTTRIGALIASPTRQHRPQSVAEDGDGEDGPTDRHSQTRRGRRLLGCPLLPHRLKKRRAVGTRVHMSIDGVGVAVEQGAVEVRH